MESRDVPSIYNYFSFKNFLHFLLIQSFSVNLLEICYAFLSFDHFHNFNFYFHYSTILMVENVFTAHEIFLRSVFSSQFPLNSIYSDFLCLESFFIIFIILLLFIFPSCFHLNLYHI